MHSKIVGGSTAKRVINCPGSVALCAKMPPQVSSAAAQEGTALHAVMDMIANDADLQPSSFLGRVIEGVEITDAHVEKLEFAKQVLDGLGDFLFVSECRVDFGDLLPGVFGSCDLLGIQQGKTILLDYKFGDGVMVDADENEQLMFYAAAAMRSQKWAFQGASEIECIIVQPPYLKSWTTTPDRLRQFEQELVRAVKASQQPDAPVRIGDHCRWCTAKTICPQMNGEIDRLTQRSLDALDDEQLGAALALAGKLETFIADARALAQQRLESGTPVPGFKLVPKRATRQWVDTAQVTAHLDSLGIEPGEYQKTEILSVAQMEKMLKKRKVELPYQLYASVSSGNTIAPQDDPRTAVMVTGLQLKAALSKLGA
jgi:hypothetical protein